MQRQISNRVFLGQTTSPMSGFHLPSTEQLQTILMLEVVSKNRELIITGTYDPDIARCIPGVLKLVFQGMLADIDTKEKPTTASYKEI